VGIAPRDIAGLQRHVRGLPATAGGAVGYAPTNLGLHYRICWHGNKERREAAYTAGVVGTAIQGCGNGGNGSGGRKSQTNNNGSRGIGTVKTI